MVSAEVKYSEHNAGRDGATHARGSIERRKP